MFENILTAPRDAILGLAAQFKADSNPNKVDLSVGVYKDETGATPIFQTVKKAERRLLEKEASKGYLPIDGLPEYAAGVQELVLGQDASCTGRAVTVQTPGGTGALRVAGEFIRAMLGEKCVHLSQPTWPNHASIFAASGLKTKTYPYFDAAGNRLDFAAMIAALKQIPEGDVVLLHGCCHNPTGVDPTAEQWKQIASVVAERKLLPLVDFAYQGLGQGLREDAAGVEALCRTGVEMLVCSSFSKNFGLYNERVGALTAVAGSSEAAQAVLSQLKRTVRAMYSNPPAHGAQVVAAILADPALRAEWEKEVAAMRERIHRMRCLLAESLKANGVKRDFSFIMHQQGMFSFSGLSDQQVERLRAEAGIYIVGGGGRINVAGLTEKNIPVVCKAIAKVL